MIKAFFSNSIGILVSRILGLARDLITAAVLGAGMWSDLFFVAFKLPNLFRRLFAEGAFTQAFLPSFVRASKKGIFAAEILTKFAGIILLLTLCVMLFAPLFTKALAFGFDQELITNAAPLVRINFWYLFFIFIVTFLASMLQYRGHFATTAFSTSLLNISMIIALVLSRGETARDAVYYLSYGVVIGGMLQVLIHLIALYYTGMAVVLSGGLKRFVGGIRANTKGFYSLFASGVIGSSAAQLGSFMNTWLASFLATGSISYLYYADRIFQLPLAVFAIALSTALFPRISKLIKAENFDAALINLSKSFHFLLLFLLLFTVGGVVLSQEIIKLIFERGEFSSQNTKECAFVLAMYMLGLIPYGLSKLFSLWLYAKMQQKLAAKITVIVLVVNLAFCLVLMKPMGAAGLGLASSISGATLLILSIRAFGFNNFLAIICAKKLLLILIISILECLVLIFLKGYIYDYLLK